MASHTDVVTPDHPPPSSPTRAEHDAGLVHNRVEIRALTPARHGDFMAFFEGEAFSDNPAWSSCYCQCYLEDHSRITWSERTAAQNRACASQRILGGHMQGLLAYCHERVIGWCSAAPRSMFHALDAEPIPNADRVGAILCFIVAPGFRGRGVASALLHAACIHLGAQGLRVAEANPRSDAQGAAANHFGFLGMYLSAGFTVQRTDADGSVWVSKSLQASP